MTDRVCILYERTACVSNFGFLAMGNTWEYYNLLGLAPKSTTKGPVFIQHLANDGVISSETATLHYNTFESQKPSSLVLGTIEDESSLIKGFWYDHKLVYENKGDYETFSLNIVKVKYGGDVIFGNFNSLLVSITNDLMYIGSAEKDLYFNWEAKMSAIEGVTCGTVGEEPRR